MMPRMLYDRLDELGIDFGIVYPTAGLGIPRIADDETRRAVIRGFNIVTAEYFAELSDRLTPAAVIPMHTPDEAIEELEFVTKQLGAKVCMFGSGVAPAACRTAKGVDPPTSPATPVLTTSSASTATTTTTRSGRNAASSASRRPSIPAAAAIGLRNSPTNFTFNHIGHFAAAGHAVAKALFLGGVTRRFPDLRFALPRRRRRLGLPAVRRPDRALGAARRQGHRLHGPDQARPHAAARAGRQVRLRRYRRRARQARRLAAEGRGLRSTGGVPALDDYAACKITQKQDWIDLYATPYYFGCEADDRMNAVAFGKAMPFGARINAIFSSDIGHFDVADMRDPLPEAYELVEDGLITETISATSPSPTPCGCGARRTRASSRARRWPRRRRRC